MTFLELIYLHNRNLTDKLRNNLLLLGKSLKKIKLLVDNLIFINPMFTQFRARSSLYNKSAKFKILISTNELILINTIERFN